jgi:glutamate dehydrogenase
MCDPRGVPGQGDPSAGAVPPALEPLLERIAAETGDRDGPATALAIAAYRRASYEELTHLDVNTVAAQMLAAVEFIDAREPGTLALRVSNPQAETTAVEVNIEDSPFLLSTIDEELGRLGLATVDVVPPLIGVERSSDGRLAAILPARKAKRRESYIRLQLDRRLDDDEVEPVAASLRGVLTDTLAATRDFPAMLARVHAVSEEMRADAPRRYQEAEVTEAAALLDWLVDDHFVFLGYREYDLADADGERCVMVRAGSGLGILADESSSAYAQPVPLAQIPAELRERMEGGDLLLVSRTNRISTVHRQARMIYVGVKKVDEAGTVSGEHRFLGLFAQKAYAEPASAIPVLRRKLAGILELEDIVDHSYDERALRTLFESFPKHELFQASVTDLRRVLVRLLEARKRQDVRFLFRTDVLRRTVSALVAMPPERFNDPVRT